MYSKMTKIVVIKLSKKSNLKKSIGMNLTTVITIIIIVMIMIIVIMIITINMLVFFNANNRCLVVVGNHLIVRNLTNYLFFSSIYFNL